MPVATLTTSTTIAVMAIATIVPVFILRGFYATRRAVSIRHPIPLTPVVFFAMHVRAFRADRRRSGSYRTDTTLGRDVLRWEMRDDYCASPRQTSISRRTSCWSNDLLSCGAGCRKCVRGNL